MRVYVSLLCIPISFSIRSINIVGQIKDILGMKKRQASKHNLHTVKTSMKAIIFQVFDHFAIFFV